MSPIARQAANPTRKPVQNIPYSLQDERVLGCAVAILRRNAEGHFRRPAGASKFDVRLGETCEMAGKASNGRGIVAANFSRHMRN